LSLFASYSSAFSLVCFLLFIYSSPGWLQDLVPLSCDSLSRSLAASLCPSRHYWIHRCLKPNMLFATLSALALAAVSRASPLDRPRTRRSNNIGTTSVDLAVVNADLIRPAQFSRLAYCSSPSVQTLNCGAPCNDLGAGSVSVLLTGGCAHASSFIICVRSHARCREDGEEIPLCEFC
jgi:hypothetical protein